MHIEPTIAIRAYEVEDADALFEAAVESIDSMYPWMPWCTPAYTPEEARAWVQMQVNAFRSRAQFEFVIVGRDGRFLGACGLNDIDGANRRANLGYWVRASAVGRGIASTATRLLVRWAFEQTDFERLEVVVAAGNERSLAVAAKAGATREGLLRNRLILHAQVHDAVMHSFVRGRDG
ncbi:MAG TPA: GNAT family N-acetyltransferase [Longimicrobiaceae bacterium]|jgi:RimJ/RimL family protein N-acetyltransferase|nr:GNAT family N-acetyltransferase [Longimicrobiaceae bacterium]